MASTAAAFRERSEAGSLVGLLSRQMPQQRQPTRYFLGALRLWFRAPPS